MVQSDLLPLSTWLVAPTSKSARTATFRPEVEVLGELTRVLAEQTAAIDPKRLGAAATPDQRRAPAGARALIRR